MFHDVNFVTFFRHQLYSSCSSQASVASLRGRAVPTSSSPLGSRSSSFSSSWSASPSDSSNLSVTSKGISCSIDRWRIFEQQSLLTTLALAAQMIPFCPGKSFSTLANLRNCCFGFRSSYSVTIIAPTAIVAILFRFAFTLDLSLSTVFPNDLRNVREFFCGFSLVLLTRCTCCTDSTWAQFGVLASLRPYTN